MGTDIIVHLLYGHKMTLSAAFENGLIYPGIMDEDDWQLVDDAEYREEIIGRHVTSPQLSEMLQGGEWNIRIVASTQEVCKPEDSFLFIYNRREILYSGRVPDYETGVVPSPTATADDVAVVNLIPAVGVYAAHWVVEGSW